MINQFFLSILTALFVFYTPIAPLILIVGVMILIDTIGGVYTAYKTKEPVTSSKLSKVLGKLVIYTTIQLLVYALDFYLLQHFIPLCLMTRLVAAGLIGIELISLDEKLRKLNDGKGFKFYFTKLKNIVMGLKKDVNDMLKK